MFSLFEANKEIGKGWRRGGCKKIPEEIESLEAEKNSHVTIFLHKVIWLYQLS